MDNDDATGVAKARRLLEEQHWFFKKGGAELDGARAKGIGFLYDEDEGQLKEKDKAPAERPEDSIPDLPENREAREFLAKAPTKGLFMPLGKEVKVMQCWRCKQFGHRTGDRECPLFLQGNLESDARRQAREDPMSSYVGVRVLKQEEKEARRAQLQALVDEIRAERKEKKKQKRRKKKEEKRRKKEAKRRKNKEEGKKRRRKDDGGGSTSSSRKRRRSSSGSNSESDGSDSDSSSSSSSSSGSDGGGSNEGNGDRKAKKRKA